MNEYFSHDYNSRRDRKMIALSMKHNLEGIGAYWCILEMLYEEAGYMPIEDYERIKDEGIESIGKDSEKKPTRIILQRNALFYMLYKDYKVNQLEIAEKMTKLLGKEYDRSSISKAILSFTRESDL